MNTLFVQDLTGNSVVDAVTQMGITGNVIPPIWHRKIKYENMRGDFSDPFAAILLAEIVYWYRGTEVFNPATGQIIGWKKKFNKDKLRRSYSDLCEKFGFRDGQVRSAMKLLQRLNLIDLEFRTENIGGVMVGNVMYIGLNPERLMELTYDTRDPKLFYEAINKTEDTYPTDDGEGVYQMVEPTIYTKSSHRPHTNIRARAENLESQEKTPIASPQVDIPSVATTIPLEGKSTPQEYIPSSKKPKTPLKPNLENLVIPEVQPRQQWQSSTRKCEDVFKPVAPWRTGKGRNQFNSEVVDFLIKTYLANKPYYASLGEVSRGSAIGWLTKREYDEKGIAEIEAMMIDFSEYKAKLFPLANAKTAVNSELPSWVRLGREWAFTQYREYLETGFNAYKFGHPQSEIDIWEEYLSTTYPGEIVEKCAEKKRLAWSQIKQTA